MVTAIVLAAGKGSRMNSDIAKQYIRVCGKEILYYSLRVFQDCEAIDNIILVVGKGDTDFCKESIIDAYGFDKVNKICEGGEQRYNSVYNGILAAREIGNGDDDIVMIHDGARPFVDNEMILSLIDATKKFGASTLGVPVKDTIKIVDENLFGIETPDRKKLYQIQTPQTFKTGVIFNAYKSMFECANYNITDDTMLIEQYGGVNAKIVMGSYKNIKITTPEDIEITEKFLQKNFKKCVDK